MSGLQRRLLVVEDEALMSSLLVDVVSAAGFSARSAEDVVTARDLVESFDPDVALIDINLGPGPSGLDLAHVLHVTNPGIALLILTKHPDPRTAGIQASDVPPGCGFLRKDLVDDSTYLLAAIESVLRDQPESVRHDLYPHRPLARLTASQVEVLRMVAQGLTNTAIAQHRRVSERAVEKMLQAIFTTLGISPTDPVNPRVEAVRMYIEAAGLPARTGPEAESRHAGDHGAAERAQITPAQPDAPELGQR